MFYQYISALAFLIGNKSDLERSVTKDSVVDFAEAHGFEGAFDMSAKTGAFNLTFCLFFPFIHSFIHSFCTRRQSFSIIPHGKHIYFIINYRPYILITLNFLGQIEIGFRLITGNKTIIQCIYVS